MDFLAMKYIERQVEKLERRELRRIAKEIRDGQARLQPLFKKHRAAKKARMRQDGRKGFVMVTE